MLTIKVLGPGCANCKKLDAIAREAAANLQLDAEFIKVSDFAEIMAYSVLSTPGLVINDKVVCAGRIPTLAEVTKWLTAITNG
ncbi:MAG: glutaredoxin [Deltaproteobacteria bacterium RIFOXYD12_FULL_57_12]|nr:MAG: glutaredoxin [Deltaproteobacteria bacterium RIFOXYD12_FULL_57_12]